MPIDENILLSHNPWWRDGHIPSRLRGLVRREIAEEIKRSLPLRQIILLRGPRRVGKTTLIYQLMNDLLSEGVKPLHLVYVSTDDPLIADKANFFPQIEKFIQERILRQPLQEFGEIIYLFLDEIQALPQWELFLKRYFDLGYPLKFVISSSASLPLLHKSRESLAGRVLDFLIYPFSLSELAHLREKEELAQFFSATASLWQEFWKDLSWPLLGEGLRTLADKWFPFKPLILSLVEEYLLWGGFPEYLQMEEELRERYFWDNIVERVIHRDIPSVVEIRDRELLGNLLLYTFSYPAKMLNMSQLANNFGSSKLTISTYLRYLQGSFLVYFLEKYTRSTESRLRAFKKTMLVDPGLYANISRLSPLSPSWEKELGTLAEIAVFAQLRRRARNLEIRYWRERDKEVDFVIDFLDQPIALEVKYRTAIAPRDLRSLDEFCSRFKIPRSMVVTKDLLRHDESRLLVPLWLF